MSGAEPGRDLGALLRPAIDEAGIADAWQRLAAARAPGRAPPRRVLVLGLAGAAALAVALVLAWPSADTPRLAAPLASKDGAVLLGEGAAVSATADAARVLELADGSTMTLAPAARIEVLANTSDRFVALLALGNSRFDLRGDGTRRWEIETALATVEGTAATFTVERGATSTIVAVERGVVVLRGERVAGRIQRLIAGERVEITAGIQTAVIELPQPQGPSPSSRALRDTSTRPDPATSFRALRDTSTRPDPATSPSPRPVVTNPGSELAAALASADRLRAAGDPSGAAAVLDGGLAAAGGAPGAGLAAFTLGRLALDVLDQPARAARAFARVIALGSPASLLEDAYARHAEALIAAVDASAAAAVDAYARAYPRGRRLAALQARLLATP